MAALSERQREALRRLRSTVDEIERLGTQARALLTELEDLEEAEDEPCSQKVRERTRAALRQLQRP